MWQQKVANHSERCSVNYKVEIARAVSVMFHSSDEFDIDAYIEFLGDTFYLLPHDLGTDVIPCVHGSLWTGLLVTKPPPHAMLRLPSHLAAPAAKARQPLYTNYGEPASTRGRGTQPKGLGSPTPSAS